jgi:D-lactate dehydrogenase
MTFRAAGTSLSGQAVTDGILVDISKHWDAYSVEDGADRIRFQPGIVGGFLNNVLKPHGRRIGPDPASIDACMMGGILANNSSGMCCGVTENSYRTIHSMTFVLPNGFTLDTSHPDANKSSKTNNRTSQRDCSNSNKEFSQSTTDHKGEKLAEKIRRRYQIKNNNGYLLNAFLDFDHPLDILVHLLIGSEGTLGFIAEACSTPCPTTPRKSHGADVLQEHPDAAAAIYPLSTIGRARRRDHGPRVACGRWRICRACPPFSPNSLKAPQRSWWSIRLGMQNQFPV